MKDSKIASLTPDNWATFLLGLSPAFGGAFCNYTYNIREFHSDDELIYIL